MQESRNLRLYLLTGNNVTKSIPSYLRIHRGTNPASTKVVPPHDSMGCFWDAYSDATGWRIDQRAIRSEVVELIPAVNSETTEIGVSSGVSKNAAARLAESAARLAEELQRNREAMRRQEVELASAPRSWPPIAIAIESPIELKKYWPCCGCMPLSGGSDLFAGRRDTVLKARAVFGLPTQRLEEQARPLRGSRADLEAMVQDVVMIEDLNASALETWNSPEPFDAGICAAIPSDGIPIGTLWLFSDENKQFSTAESAVARFAAAQIGLELAIVGQSLRISSRIFASPFAIG